MAAISTRTDSNIHPSRAQITLLDVEEVAIPPEYADYTDVFSPDYAAELLEHTGIDNHNIGLVDGKQQPYGSMMMCVHLGD